jgi:hypothetical protein
MKFITKFDISRVTLADIPEVVEQFRSYGAPSVNFDTAEISCIFEVGEGGAAEDLWDLRDVCEEIEANLGSYVSLGDARIPKPTLFEAS